MTKLQEIQSNEELEEEEEEEEMEKEEEEEQGLTKQEMSAINDGVIGERNRMLRLLQALSREQYHRYETYRRAKFAKSTVKRLLLQQTGLCVNDKAVLAIAAIAKVLLGEVIELALDYRQQLGETSDGEPLRPRHIREAWRRLRGPSSAS